MVGCDAVLVPTQGRLSKKLSALTSYAIAELLPGSLEGVANEKLNHLVWVGGRTRAE